MFYSIRNHRKKIKKLFTILLTFVLMFGSTLTVCAGELNEYEKWALKKLSSKDFSVEIEGRYINQLQNYLCRDKVSLSVDEAEDFVAYLEEALLQKRSYERNGKTFTKASNAYINLEKAGTILGLLIEYDSVTNRFYAIDSDGYIVIDSQDIIKNTDAIEDDSGWNVSIEVIFAISIFLCILGVLINFRRWNKDMRNSNQKKYDEEDEDELEVADRKAKRARLETPTYINLKYLLKCFYVPILMGLVIVAIGYFISSPVTDFKNSLVGSFMNTQPVNFSKETEFKAYEEAEDKQPNLLPLKDVVMPKFSEQYGLLENKDLKISAPIYFGDRGEQLEKGAGSYIGSFLPGFTKPILIGAHDTTYFEGLKDVKVGDEFTFTTTYGIYRYRVVKTKVYKADDEKAYDLNANREQLILYTCYPFGTLKGTKTERLFVYLDLISGPRIKM